MNSLFIGSIVTNPSDLPHTTSNMYEDWLGDSGAQIHVKFCKGDASIKIAEMPDGRKCEINAIRDLILSDELGSKIELKDTHSIVGVNKNIISINQLRSGAVNQSINQSKHSVTQVNQSINQVNQSINKPKHSVN